MGGFSLWHWLIVGIAVLLLFGKGRFSDMMGDVAKGVKAFKKGMSEEEDAPPAGQRPVTSALPAHGQTAAPTLIEGSATPLVAPAAPVETRSAAEIIAEYEQQKAAKAAMTDSRPL